MFQILSGLSKRKITSLNDVYFTYYYKLGNLLIAINKVIFYCEILQCKRIILNRNILNFFKNVIYDKNYDLLIEPETKAKNFNSRSAFHWPHPYYTVLGVNPENRFDVFKEEMLTHIRELEVKINNQISNKAFNLNKDCQEFTAQMNSLIKNLNSNSALR